MGARRRGLFHDAPVPVTAPANAARGRVRHLPPRVRCGLRGRRHLPDHHASAYHRLSFAHLDHRGADPAREVAARRVVRDACGGRGLRKGACGIMRIAVVADIHGNVRALRAVMEDLKQVAPDSVVNLGDCASGPLEAAETIDVLMSLAWTTVRGNHDRQLLDRPIEKMGSSDKAAASELKNHHSAWLSTLDTTAEIEDLLLCHGTPD